MEAPVVPIISVRVADTETVSIIPCNLVTRSGHIPYNTSIPVEDVSPKWPDSWDETPLIAVR